ncbi:hypothetical protein HDU67_007161 [Dinochytrium kinnereticum]|nr:hypothetical protein HDU67_007161 [Dinochytrium kinnereticum]
MASAGAAASVLGNKVRVTLVTDAVHEGLIYAYEPLLGILVLQSQPTTSPAAAPDSGAAPTSHSLLSNTTRPDFHIIRVGTIKDVLTISTYDASAEGGPPKKEGSANGFAEAVTGKRHTPLPIPKTLFPVNYVPIEKALAREHAIHKAEAGKIAKIGIGVTEDAQELFYALDKTLPTRWMGTTIVVMDEVQIQPPYTANDVKGGGTTASNVVSRVKKVLELERQKLLAAKGAK